MHFSALLILFKSLNDWLRLVISDNFWFIQRLVINTKYEYDSFIRPIVVKYKEFKE